MVQFTKEARSKILQFLQEMGNEYYFRVGIKGEACTGSLIIGLDKKRDDDELHNVDGIGVIIKKKHLMYVIGTHVKVETHNGEEVFQAQLN